MKFPKMLLKTSILRRSVSFQIIYIITIPKKIFIATVPFTSLYNENSNNATSAISKPDRQSRVTFGGNRKD